MKTKYVSTDETVIKRVIKHGGIANKPIDGSVVHLHIEDVQVIKPDNLDITQVNSKILTDKSDVSFTIDEVDNEVDRQIERAIKWMGMAEVAYICVSFTHSSPGDTVIEFKATLTQHQMGKYIWELTPEEKYERAARYKDMAVNLVHENRNKDAFYRFSKAVKLIITLEPIDDLELDEKLYKNIYDLRTGIYNNMAMCQLKFNNYDHTIALCTKVLARDKNNVKAMYRRGCAYGGNRNVERALNDFQKVVHVEPTNTAAWEKMKMYCDACGDAEKRNNELLKKMFNI